MDLGKRYTRAEADLLEEQGYEFKEATLITDVQPMYVVADYRPPGRRSYGVLPQFYFGEKLL